LLKKLYPILEKKLAGLGVKDFEVFYQKKIQRSFIAKDASLESAEESVQSGVALRLFKDHRTSFAYSTELSEGGLQGLCESAVAILPLIDPDEDYQLPKASSPSGEVDLKDFDPALNGLSPQKKLAVALTLEKSAQAVDPRVKHVRSAGYDEEIAETALMNSAGLSRSHRKTGCSVGVMAVAEEGEAAEGGYEFDFSPYFDALDPERVGRAAGELAVGYLGAQTPRTGRYPVILDPLVAGEFLQALSRSFQGDAVYKKSSFLAGKLGHQVYGDPITIVDDRSLPGGWESGPFDGEGQPSRCLTLVEHGRLQAYLLDGYYGRKLGTGGNASSVRQGIKQPPAISHSNLILKAGDLSDDEIFRQADRGILVTEVIGMHATDRITGDFSVGAQGFLIERGAKAAPVKKIAIAGNLHQIMKEIRWVGSRYRFYFNIGAPTLGFAEMAVSGA
jgi:PmbA protein